MSDIDWKGLPEDLEKILEKNPSLEVKYSVKELTWSSGDSRYEVSYEVIAENGSWKFTEDYSLDRDDEDDGYSLADYNLNNLRKEMSKKGYITNMKDNSLNINSKLI